jgi:hypothetical protein
MPVTGVFQADFGSFFDAVDKSEVKLKALDAGANRVETGLSRMATAFSGQKIIQDATLMAEVFERAGGAAAFTEKELARMGATGREAIEKLEALGQDVPDGLREMSAQAKQADESFDGLTSTVKSFAIGLVAAFSFDAIKGFVSDIMTTAGALADLSDQTRINVEELQFMSQAMSTFGVSTDELGRALFKLSNAIANGDDGVSDALLQMGMSIEEVRGMNGEELFLTIQNGLATLNGTLRDTTAVELYGEKLGRSMAGAAEGTQAAIDNARAFNNVMSQETVRALDEADEAIGRMMTNLTNMAANMIGPVAQGFNVLVDAAIKGASTWEIFVAMSKDLWHEWGTGTPQASELATVLDRLNQSAQATAQATQGATAATRAYIPATADMTGETKRLREETEKLNAARLKDFEDQTKRAALNQKFVDDMIRESELMADRAKFDAEQKVIQDNKLAAGAAWMKQAGEIAARNKELAEMEKVLTTEQEKQIPIIIGTGVAHEEAGTAAVTSTAAATAGYAQMGQQVALTAEAIRGMLAVAKVAAAANAIYQENSLFTTKSQLERIAAIPIPEFAGGVENFSGGLAKVHAGELLVNLPSGTSVIPKGAGGGGGITVSNTFNMVDTESNLARRVSETIMRTVRAGTQLGTT